MWTIAALLVVVDSETFGRQLSPTLLAQFVAPSLRARLLLSPYYPLSSLSLVLAISLSCEHIDSTMHPYLHKEGFIHA